MISEYLILLDILSLSMRIHTPFFERYSIKIMIQHEREKQDSKKEKARASPWALKPGQKQNCLAYWRTART